MAYTMWFLGLLILQVVHSGSTTLQKKDSPPRQHCYLCNGASCGTEYSALCPPEAPYCATSAESPNFNSSLTCSVLTVTPCVITFTGERQLIMKCVCAEDYCNAPFTDILRSHLLNFTKHAANYSTEELSHQLQNMTKFPNATYIYKQFSVKITEPNITQNSSKKIHEIQSEIPRAEALMKHEATPSDDEEDENEGSGAYEESRSHFHPSPPTNPSSYLPANENKAVPLYITSFLSLALLFLLIIA